MHLRRIKVLGIAVPLVGLLGFELFRHFVLQPAMGEQSPHLDEHIVSGLALFVAVVAFSWWIFRLLERTHRQLVALNEAAVAVTGDLDLDHVLQRVAELSRSVSEAAYASVEVEGSVHAVTSGEPPRGGPSISLPIVVKGVRLGELVLCGLRGRRFRADDRRALETFATQAGIAIENARLFEQVQELVAARERVRIGMDLHDGVVQELFALGLKLEDVAEGAHADTDTKDAVRDARATLRRVIGEIRTYAYDLRDGDRSVDLAPALRGLVEEQISGPPSIDLRVEGDLRLPAAEAANVLHVVREALSNAVRHAQASRVAIRAGARGGVVELQVVDDGRGFDPEASSGGLGIRDMRERAAWCRGGFVLRSSLGRGTTVRLSVPVVDGVAEALR